jgi:hypothetical protein
LDKNKKHLKAGGNMNSTDYLSLVLAAVLITVIFTIVYRLYQNHEYKKKRITRLNKIRAMKNASR